MPTELVADGRVDWSAVQAVLFDLDGVLTPTALVHEHAWKSMFDAFLRRRSAATGEPFAEFTPADYLAHVDGKPRYDGVRSFVASRGITLPEGDPSDPPGDGTICALGNSKNDAFLEVLRTEGIAPYPGSVAFLDAATARGIAVAVVSSSRNAPEVLQAAGLAPRFHVVVDGVVAADEGLAGKPAPDMFWAAADRLGAERSRSVVVEDAISGVAAGAAGDFATVVGVDRGAAAESLLAAGADFVINDLAELVTSAESS